MKIGILQTGHAPDALLDETGDYDQLFERLDPTDGAQREKVAREGRELLLSFPWLPAPFRDVLEGKNYLPKRKLRLGLFGKKHGHILST